jgi:hypothetical protein
VNSGKSKDFNLGHHDMDEISEDRQLVKRVHWLIKLRWLAVVGVIGATFFTTDIFGISLRQNAIYCTAASLALYNLAMLICLKYTAN